MNWRKDYNRFLAAVEKAEGGPEALIKAVQCSIPGVTTYDEALLVLKNTVTHALWDLAARDIDYFISFFGSRWAPVGADNDPKNLNANWVPNVRSIYHAGD